MGTVNAGLDPPPSGVRVRLFGEVDVEGEQGDRSVKLKPLSRALLARLALAPGERLDTEELAKLLVVGVEHGTPVGADMLSSARRQLRNAQWELRKRLGDKRSGARLLGTGRHWVALEGARSDYREFLEAVHRGDGERARTIASRGEFLAGIDDPWTATYRGTVREGLRRVGEPSTGDGGEDVSGEEAGQSPPRPAGSAAAAPQSPPARAQPAGSPTAAPQSPPTRAQPAGSAAAAPQSPPARAPRTGRQRALKLAAVAAALACVVGIGVAALDGDQADLPDAATAPADIAPNGDPVDLGPKPAGRCQQVLRGASAPKIANVRAAGRTLGQVRTYYQPELKRTCAKLVKPERSPLRGVLTHMGLTLCGDGNECAQDSHAYRTDAGPVVVASGDGCVSWRVTMGDEAGGWLVRHRVGRTGC